MDEPFGAVDPIRRERLQNEFLRLQEQVRKTIIFVTHDVDEAIKMGDRIAILQRGGILAQYDTPAAILAEPGVGIRRALRRRRSRPEAPVARPRPRPRADRAGDRQRRRGSGRCAAAARIAPTALTYALLVDDESRPLGWIDQSRPGRQRTDRSGLRRRRAPRRCSRETTLRDALSALLGSSVQLGVVVDARGPGHRPGQRGRHR